VNDGGAEGAECRHRQSSGLTDEWKSTTLGRGVQNRQKWAARPKVTVCFGPQADDPFDLGALRGGGLGYMRVREVLSSKFASTLRREHALGHMVDLLHMELPSSADGVVFANARREGAWLRRQLSGVRVLVLAQHTGVEPADWFDAVPCVVTIGEGIDGKAARVLAEHFWQAIGQGREASAALAEALAQCPAGTEARVRGHFGHAVDM
jgi:hypothetical protein